MAPEELLLCNEAIQVQHEGSSAHTASTGPGHCHGWEGEVEVPQGGEGDIQAVSHQLSTSL